MRVQGLSERRRGSVDTETPHERKERRSTTNTFRNQDGDNDTTTFVRSIQSKKRKRQHTSSSRFDRRYIINNDPQELIYELLEYLDRIEPPYFQRHRRLQQANDINSNNIDSDKSKFRDNKSNSHDKTIKATATATSQLQHKLPPPEFEVPIDKVQIIPLYHGYGTYYIDLWCGSPIPQHQTMIVDTGSSTTAMTCLPDCTPSRCGLIQQYHPVYVPHKSSSYQKVTHCNDCTVGTCVKVNKTLTTHDTDTNIKIDNNAITEYECIWNAAYQEGSNWTAFEAMDQCYIGGLRNTPIRILQQSSSLRGRNEIYPVSQRNDNATSSINTNIEINPNLAAKHHQFRLQFGCQTSLYGNFRTQDTSGIIGLNIGPTAIWNQMYQQQIISKRAFSICIQSPLSLLHHSSTSGIMTLGGTHTPIHQNTMVYAQQHHNTGNSGNGLYMIKLQNIYLSPVTTTFPEKNTRIDPSILQKIRMPSTQDFVRTAIIDSGTTDTYFAEQLGEPFRNAWLNLYGIPYTNEPMSLSEDELKQLPTIVLQFQGHADSNKELLNDPAASEYLTNHVDTDYPYDVLFVIPPSTYMEYDDGMYKSSIYFDEPENNVFGANIMTNHDIHFDIEFHRIGFAESSCNYTLLVAPYSAHATSIEHTNSATRGATTASKLKLQPTLLTNAFTIYDMWRPASFLVIALAVIGLLRCILTLRKGATISINTTFGTDRISNVRRGRRRRQPQQSEQPILHRMRMVARSISRDRSEFISSMNQLPISSSSTYYNRSPARRHQSFTENNEPKKLSQSIPDSDDAANIARIEKENCSTTATTTAREVRRGTNILRSRSYQISFRADGA